MTMRRRSLAASICSCLLALSLAAPVQAEEPTDGTIQLHVDIVGYVAGFQGTDLTLWIGCDGMFEPIGLSVQTTPLSGDSTPAGPFAVGTHCRAGNADVGWAGEMGTFGPPVITPLDFVVLPGANQVNVVLERSWSGQPPEWDNGIDVMLEPFTADHAYVNRYGGLTVDGRLWCPAIEGLPFADGARFEQYIGVSWEAIQYAGKRAAITAGYQPAIAVDCFDDKHPTEAVAWQTLGPGTQDQVQWIYSSNGKFGAGMVHFEIRVESWTEVVTQWWDPNGDMYDAACSATPRQDGWFDQNGDGFCAFIGVIWGAEQYDLRAARVR